MRPQEIVAAVIDSIRFTGDLSEIDACSAFGNRVRFVTRTEAQKEAQQDQSGKWPEFAEGPTLYLRMDGTRFRAS